MQRHKAPTREPEETPLNFIVRFANWLAEPDRRRLGQTSRQQIIDAAKELEQD